MTAAVEQETQDFKELPTISSKEETDEGVREAEILSGCCVFCKEEIKVMIFRGTGVCGELHAKLARKNRKD